MTESPYAEYPNHPLHDVPLEILEAAREAMYQAALWGDVDTEQADPIADAVVMALLPWIKS